MKKKSPLDNIKILSAVIAVIIISLLFFLAISKLFLHAIYTPGTASILIFIVFMIIIFINKSRAGWSYHGMLIVCITALAGCLFDAGGNPVYNKPLQWLYRNIGQLEVVNTTSNYGSEYYISFLFRIVDKDGTIVRNINSFAIFIFRFIEYTAIYSLLLTVFVPVITWLRKDTAPGESTDVQERVWDGYEEKAAREMEKRKQSLLDSQQIDSRIEEEIRDAMQKGQTIYAIKLVRMHTSLSIGEAKELVEKYK